MKRISNPFFNFIKAHKVWSVIILLVIMAIAWFFAKNNSANVNYTEETVVRRSISEVVSVTGNVKPLSSVDLAFELSGRVSNIDVTVGDKVSAGQNLAELSNTDLNASLSQSQANLKKALAQYQDVKAGTTAEQLALQQTQVDKSTQDLAQAQTNLMSAIKNSYTSADDALRNKIYSLFSDPIRIGAKLSFSTDSFLQSDIESGKDTLNSNLSTWYQTFTDLNSNSDLESYYNNAKINLVAIKSLLDKCATAVSGLNSSSNIPQVQIDTWKANISLARTNIDGAINTLTSNFNTLGDAESALKIAQNQLSIGKAGSTANAILSAEASYQAAQAAVDSAKAQLAKSIIKSPIDGVITNINPKLGEIVPAGTNVISVISYGDYEVETFVPEADIAKIKIGNFASTTLDAYGSGVDFETTVIKIDPAATVIDGVPTYKVTLKFVSQDDRIKSGMTANLDILTHHKDGVLVLPSRVISSQVDGKYVSVVDVKNPSKLISKLVITGLRGADGNVEIVSGLNEGDKVVSSPTAQ